MDLPSLHIALQLPLDRFRLDVAFETTHRVTGLFGASGAGKTSLLEAVAGLRRGVTGHLALGAEVWLDTATGRVQPPEARGIGYVPQDSLLFPHLDVAANLRVGRRRGSAAHAQATFDEVVEVLALAPLLARRPTTLSGGERQRVALGRALCSAPRLLLLDEPMASLDAALRHRVLPFLQAVRRRFDVPMLLVSHDPLEVQALCDDLVVLREGRLLARGAPHDVLRRPEVFPVAAEEGFENVLEGTLLAADDQRSTVRLTGMADAPVLMVPPARQALGTPLLVSIPARDVILASQRPQGLSARNVLPALVEAVTAAGPRRLVTARFVGSHQSLLAEVTASAVEELELAPGAAVYLILKARAFTLYEYG